MLSNDDIQRLRRLVNLAPYMDREMQAKFLDLIRKLKSAKAQGCGLPASAVAEMEKAVPTELIREIVNDNKRTSLPGWLPPPKSEPVVRGSGWASPPKHEDRSRQFAVFDAMVAHIVGGPNEPVK